MDRATGVCPKTTSATEVIKSKADYEEFVRQDTWLQINDLIVGQKDRHSGNIIIGPGGKVTGIDNDGCLPEDNDTHLLHGMNYDKLPPNFPPYIDQSMKNAILGLQYEDLKGIMEQNGRDTNTSPFSLEFAAMRYRLDNLKAYVNTPPENSGPIVLDNEQAWNSNDVINAQNFQNSYACRHISCSSDNFPKYQTLP